MQMYTYLGARDRPLRDSTYHVGIAQGPSAGCLVTSHTGLLVPVLKTVLEEQHLSDLPNYATVAVGPQLAR